jgi:hypothetical protein
MKLVDADLGLGWLAIQLLAVATKEVQYHELNISEETVLETSVSFCSRSVGTVTVNSPMIEGQILWPRRPTYGVGFFEGSFPQKTTKLLRNRGWKKEKIEIGTGQKSSKGLIKTSQ